jgi:hypothetical protein
LQTRTVIRAWSVDSANTRFVAVLSGKTFLTDARSVASLAFRARSVDAETRLGAVGAEEAIDGTRVTARAVPLDVADTTTTRVGAVAATVVFACSIAGADHAEELGTNESTLSTADTRLTGIADGAIPPAVGRVVVAHALRSGVAVAVSGTGQTVGASRA